MRNKKVLISLFLAVSLIIGSSVNVAASYGSHTGTSNGRSYTLTYTLTSSKATTGITCSAANNVQAGVKVTYVENNKTKYSDWYYNSSDPGTSAYVAWTAGTGRTITSSTSKGWTNNVLAHTIENSVE